MSSIIGLLSDDALSLQQPDVELAELSHIPHAGLNAAAEQVSSKRTHSGTLEPLKDTGSKSHSLPLPKVHRPVLTSSPSLPVPLPSHMPKPTSEVAQVDITEPPRCLESQSREAKPASRLQRIQKLWLHWSTAYRIIIAVILTVNLVCLVYVALQDLSSPSLLIATSTNLLVAVLVRQEDLINVSFNLVAKIPSTWPLLIRKIIADLHHYGGVHIGCSISALLWYCVFVAYNTISCLHHIKSSSMTAWLWIDIITCYAFMLCLLFICITAHPRLRSHFHNTFEHTHRFGGWTAVLVLWVNSGVASRSSDNTTPLYKTTPIYLLSIITLLILLPWLRIRRVSVTTRLISPRELLLTFPHPNMAYTATIKFSRAPLSEWHAFATQPSPSTGTASILVSRAGDWTTALLATPPTHLWLRSPATQNFLACAPLFASLLVVATGAGIGPVLSLLASPAIAAMRAHHKLVRVMWVLHKPTAPHWDFALRIIRAVDPAPCLFDTTRRRPDVAFEACYLARTAGVEAVMVVSNPRVTDAVVTAVKAQGGAAYGAVFDS